MKNAELRAALAKWPDDAEIALIGHLNNDLDTDVSVDAAINHPGTYVGRASWHWNDAAGTWPEGRTVIVLY